MNETTESMPAEPVYESAAEPPKTNFAPHAAEAEAEIPLSGSDHSDEVVATGAPPGAPGAPPGVQTGDHTNDVEMEEGAEEAPGAPPGVQTGDHTNDVEMEEEPAPEKRRQQGPRLGDMEKFGALPAGSKVGIVSGADLDGQIVVSAEVSYPEKGEGNVAMLRVARDGLSADGVEAFVANTWKQRG